MIDGATVPPGQLFDVGIGRLVSNHYLLPTSVAPLALVMNRGVFDRLPDAAQRIIRKYSGEWAAAQFIDAYARINREALAQLKSDPRRQVVTPSRADADAARRVFKSIAEEWVGGDGLRQDLLRRVDKELAVLGSKD
jgi:TRAP-type C4-dicarboxylate transport system substrate-binding protein